ncbi:MAG: thymidylate synthase [Candidatus Cloacimonetes bacterium]|jgi:thymidylate synthase|nr:thymidylate synthase [Candidatus Cloacimonadota bacterium]MDD4155669.1 thymidylate synthase [Candidatus Cloacimonadota bacterium]
MAIVDKIFIEMCKDILENGFSSEGLQVRPKWEDGSPAHTIKKFGVVNTYDLQKEFPILTLRPTNFKAAIDEILWIWQKKSNNINELNSKIWDSWADDNGSIGKAYGYQLARKINFPEGNMDQVDWILNTLKFNSQSRRMITNIFNHDDLIDMGLQPCAWSITLNVTGEYLNMILNQRSQDILVANNWNVVQYAILLYMFSQVSGFKVGKLIHIIADAHIYIRHIPIVEELISRQMYDAPKLEVNEFITNFYNFKVEDFKLLDYKKNKQIKNIPVAV